MQSSTGLEGGACTQNDTNHKQSSAQRASSHPRRVELAKRGPRPERWEHEIEDDDGTTDGTVCEISDTSDEEDESSDPEGEYHRQVSTGDGTAAVGPSSSGRAARQRGSVQQASRERGHKDGLALSRTRLIWTKPVNADLDGTTYDQYLLRAMTMEGYEPRDAAGKQEMVNKVLPNLRRLIEEAGGDVSLLNYTCLLNRFSRMKRELTGSSHEISGGGQRLKKRTQLDDGLAATKAPKRRRSKPKATSGRSSRENSRGKQAGSMTGIDDSARHNAPDMQVPPRSGMDLQIVGGAHNCTPPSTQSRHGSGPPTGCDQLPERHIAGSSGAVEVFTGAGQVISSLADADCTERLLHECGMWGDEMESTAALIALMDPRLLEDLKRHKERAAVAAQVAKSRMESQGVLAANAAGRAEAAADQLRQALQGIREMLEKDKLKLSEDLHHNAEVPCSEAFDAWLQARKDLIAARYSAEQAARAAEQAVEGAEQAATSLRTLSDTYSRIMPTSKELLEYMGGQDIVLQMPNLIAWAVAFMKKLPKDKFLSTVAEAAALRRPTTAQVLLLMQRAEDLQNLAHQGNSFTDLLVKEISLYNSRAFA